MKNKQAIILLLAANAVSGFAQGISVIAIPWYYINILDKASTFALVFAGVTLATLVWSLYAGTLVDRFSRKNIFLGICTGGALIMGALSAIGHQLGAVPEIGVALAFAVNIFVFNIHYPTLYAFAQELSEAKNYGKTNSMIEVQGQTVTMFAGAFATIVLVGSEAPESLLKGVLPFAIAKWELHDIFMLDGITYVLAAILVGCIRYSPIEKLERETGKLVERFRSGITFLKQNIPLLAFGIASYAIFVVLIVEGLYLLSLYVDQHLGRDASVYAFAEVCYSLGAVSAGLLIRWLFRRSNYVFGVLTMMVLAAFGFFLLAFTRSLMVFLAYNLLIGVCNSGSRIMRTTYLFNHIPNNMIGRAGSIFNSVNILERGLFLLLFALPLFSNNGGVVYAMGICGIFVAVSMLPIIAFYGRLTKR